MSQQFWPIFAVFLRFSQVLADLEVWMLFERLSKQPRSPKCCFFSDVIVRGESYALFWVVTPLTLTTQILSFMLGGIWL
nr:MAG TPA: hypothetical protein [Caudoviricetes sp.]